MIVRGQMGERTGRWAGLALAVACLAVLVYHAGHGGRVTRDLFSGWWRQQADDAQAQLDCLSERVEQLVPPGTRVHVGPGPGVELQQRISELVVYAGSEVVADPRWAELVLDAVPGGGTDCGGPALDVVAAS